MRDSRESQRTLGGVDFWMSSDPSLLSFSLAPTLLGCMFLRYVKGIGKDYGYSASVAAPDEEKL